MRQKLLLYSPSQQHKRVRRRTLEWLAAISLSPATCPSLYAQARAGGAREMSSKQLIQLVTRLSILSDRIVRNHVQKTMQIATPNPDRGLASSYAEIRKATSELLAVKSGKAVPEKMPGLAKTYLDFIQASEKLAATDQTGLVKLSEQADEVADGLDDLVSMLVKESGGATTEVLSTTADLQRLTQHLAVHYLMAKAGIDASEQMKEVVKSRGEFSQMLAKLKQSSFKPTQTDDMLSLISNQWLLMEIVLKADAKTPRELENVCTTCERLLEVLTTLYARYDSALT